MRRPAISPLSEGDNNDVSASFNDTSASFVAGDGVAIAERRTP